MMKTRLSAVPMRALVTLLRGFAEPLHRFLEVLLCELAIVVDRAQLELCVCITGVRTRREAFE